MTAGESAPVGPYAGQDRWTWLVVLHLTSDPDLAQTARDVAQDAVAAWSIPDGLERWYTDAAEGEARLRSAWQATAADGLQQWVRDALWDHADALEHDSPLLTLGLDLMGHALDRVDWEYTVAAVDPRWDPAEQTAADWED